MTLPSVRMVQRLLLGCAAASLLMAPAVAQESGEAKLQRLEDSVREQAARIDQQSRELDRQRQELPEQPAELRQPVI
jgi:outer membrane murein-binding lipoprotein Lpp